MSNRIRAGIAAGAAALAFAGLAGGAFAHPHPAGDDKKVRQIIILEDAEKGKAGAHRIVRLDGERPHCAGEKTEVVGETGAAGDKQKTRIVVCGRDGAGSPERARALAEALARVQSNDALSPEHREKVAAAIGEAMEKVSEAK